MASRRDELNAYNFARKRTVAAFLKPLPNGSVESAPRPVRALVPTIVLSVLIVVGFGGCGLLKPAAPQGWNAPGEKVIVGDKSTTRYVVLKSKEKGPDGKAKTLLHPVLNLSSARLLLDPSKFEVVKVKESILDGGDAPPQGPTIGIPYAPDRLPDSKDAGAKKTWASCERPASSEGGRIQQSTFVFKDGDEHLGKLTAGGKGKVGKRSSLYVQDPKGDDYLVDHRGVAHPLDATAAQDQLGDKATPEERERLNGLLRAILFGQKGEPQKVSEEWMDTLIKSELPIFFPPVPGAGETADTDGVPQEHRKVGRIVEGDGAYFVVLKDGVANVSPFVAKLLLQGEVGELAYPGQAPEPAVLPLASIEAEEPEFMGKLPTGQEVVWPEEQTQQANNAHEEDGRRVVCSVYHGGNQKIAGQELSVPEMTTWAGTGNPAPIVDGSGSTYVSPGSGLFYREVTGKSKDTGSLYLVTDTGLRYSVRANNDNSENAGNAEKDQNQAQIRLGYGDLAQPPAVPQVWSKLLSRGPSLNTADAKQPQGS
ncbi:type VII secretion protein EccB [Streptomyces sp. XM4193]|uniref:type VII secretion protein EccB n=1 Tax=Streptomyces sp. XM4193 TaxID=2929782 RepID=UPI001FFABC5D|nr:type VII secretion protein EccB [Streptomyces sp. XM4193]MCK1798892.1 type VII secretion protein EccB [Streptomyces sp. XM4193]